VDCLDDETLLACVEGRLAEADRLAALEHADHCRRCRELLVESLRALISDS
jgi:hypothetical protein